MARWILRAAILSSLVFSQSYGSDEVDESHEMQLAFLPDLKNADRLAEFLDQLLTKRYSGLEEPHLLIQIVHFGTRTDFPIELSWLINYLKHSFDTDPRMPRNVQVQLDFAPKARLEGVLSETIGQLHYDQAALVGTCEELESKIKEITTLLEKLEEFSKTLDSDLNALVVDLDPKSKTFTAEAFTAEISNTIQEIPDILKSLESESDDPWSKLSILQEMLQKKRAVLSQTFSEMISLEGLPQRDRSVLDHTLFTLDGMISNLIKITKLKIETKKIILRLMYSPNPRQELTSLSKSTTWSQDLDDFWKTITVNLKQGFGIPKGLTWVMYKLSFTARTPKEHIVELASGLAQGAMLFGLNYFTLEQNFLAGQNVFPLAGAATAGIWKVLTGYTDRAHNAFFVQGINFDPNRKFSTNKKLFFVSAFLHSLIISSTIQMAAVGVGNFNENILLHTAWNSFLGLFAKSLPLLLISKSQLKAQQVEDSTSHHHSKWRTIAFNFVFGITYQGLKSFHLFQNNFMELPKVFLALGLGGLSYEIFNNLSIGDPEMGRKERISTNLLHTISKYKRRFVPESFQKKRTCQSVLIIPQRQENL